MKIAFWLSIFLINFAYFGYPLTLIFLRKMKGKFTKKKPITPFLTFIITVFNEEKRIREKLENTINLDYPKEKLEIIVASDGSTDKTHNIVNEFINTGVKLLIIKERNGKEYAQAQAVKIAKGEILVFSDAATVIDSNGLKQIVSNFADNSIGCVSSKDVVITNGESNPGGESFYVKYEMWLRMLESQVNSVIGLSGSFFSARKEVCEDFSHTMQSDFRTLLNCLKLGMRGIIDPETKGYYTDIKDKSQEFGRKIRTVLRGLNVLFTHIEFFNIFRYRLFSYQYFCHKMMRWLIPLNLITAFISSSLLAVKYGFYLYIFIIEIMFYSIAVAGIIVPNLNRFIFVRIPSFFIIVNTSIFIAWIKYIKGERIIRWQPSMRIL